MGATVFHHPASYRQIARQIRSDLEPSKAGSADYKLLVGILLNHGEGEGLPHDPYLMIHITTKNKLL